VKGEIQALLLGKGTGQRVVAPGGEVGSGIGEVDAKQTRRRSDCLGKFKGLGLIGGIHAVSPEQNRNMLKT
jgi:hypothetical protein